MNLRIHHLPADRFGRPGNGYDTAHVLREGTREAYCKLSCAVPADSRTDRSVKWVCLKCGTLYRAENNGCFAIQAP